MVLGPVVHPDSWLDYLSPLGPAVPPGGMSLPSTVCFSNTYTVRSFIDPIVFGAYILTAAPCL